MAQVVISLVFVRLCPRHHAHHRMVWRCPTLVVYRSHRSLDRVRHLTRRRHQIHLGLAPTPRRIATIEGFGLGSVPRGFRDEYRRMRRWVQPPLRRSTDMDAKPNHRPHDVRLYTHCPLDRFATRVEIRSKTPHHRRIYPHRTRHENIARTPSNTLLLIESTQ